jgi:hypothetical protein
MTTSAQTTIYVADRIWIAIALLHQEYPSRKDFKKSEILAKLREQGLADGVERGTLSAHLDQHCVANVSPSSGKYRMLFETSSGDLRLFCPSDMTHPLRLQSKKPSKSIPERDKIPSEYWYLLDWYEYWCRSGTVDTSQISWEDDPLIRLRGSGRHIWADEHADEYVERLRAE